MTDDHDATRHDPFGITVHRRVLLRGGLLGGLGLAAAALIGCGGDDDDDDDEAAAVAPATQVADDEAAAPAETVEAEDTVATIERASGFTTAAGRFVPFQIEEPATPPKFGGTLTQRFTFDPGPLDPAIAAAGGTMTGVNAVYNRLLGVYSGADSDPYARNELVPELAESWEISEDGLTYTFHVQPGVKFQNVEPMNGRELTAHDAKFSFDRYSATGSPHRSNFLLVSSIEAVDAATVVITLQQPTPDFIFPLATAYSTVHGPELVDSGEILTKAVGTGPMILDFWRGGDGGAFDKNPDYFRGPVKIDRWDVPFALDLAAAQAQFRVGRHDYGLTAETSDDLEKILDTNPDTQYFANPLFVGGLALTFNMDLPRWEDVRIRRALSLAYDREEMLDIIYSGAGVVLPQMDWRFFWEEEPTAESGVLGNWWRYDPDEAKKLLDAAGASDLEFEMMYYNYSNVLNSLPNEVWLDQFSRIGVKLNLSSRDYNEYNSQWTTRSGTVDTYDGWASNAAFADHFVYGLNHSASSGNRNRINDPQIDTWAAQHQVELDPDVRLELARNVWDRVLDQVYRITKSIGYRANLMQPWVRGLRYSRGAGSGHHYLDTGYEAYNSWIDK